MAAEQGAGGGIENSQALGRSLPRPNSKGDPIQETEVENSIQNKQQDEQNGFAQASQKYLRQCHPLPASSPAPQVRLARNPPSYPNTTPSAGCSESSRRVTRPPEPPVTKATLSELDVTKIIHNPKLRHDINFDPELHFRPNVDGEKGRRKADKANQYWNTLHDQLVQFVVDRPGFYEKHGEGDDWCLPSLLKAVKEIIQTLVPQRDRVYLEEGLNVELLMQQFNRGIADLEKLATWLSRVLKSHCAPMRDEWVDEMYSQLSSGNRTNDMAELVQGMRSLLGVLEAMKLDVANHQIRCLRPVLIEDTIHFEQRFFFKKIQVGKLDVDFAKHWYRHADQRYSAALSTVDTHHAFGDMAVFFEALSRLLLPSIHEKSIPNTFLFDEERILKLRADVLDAINLEICMRVYDDLERVARSTPPPMFAGLEFNFNAPPSGPSSRPSSLVFSSAGSADSSPRSSVILPPQPAQDFLESKAKARNLYNSLVALFQTAPQASQQAARWVAMAPSMAVQLFRFTNTPSDHLPALEARLARHFTDFNAQLFHEVQEQIQRKLMTALAKRVKELRGLSGVNLFSVATGGRIHGPGRTWDTSRDIDRDANLPESAARENREDAGIEDMATRIAHLGILHWRVWSSLAYTRENVVTAEEQPENLI